MFEISREFTEGLQGVVLEAERQSADAISLKKYDF